MIWIQIFEKYFSHFTLIVRNQNKEGMEPLRYIFGTRYWKFDILPLSVKIYDYKYHICSNLATSPLAYAISFWKRNVGKTLSLGSAAS